jgi:hypothetical protein
LAKILIEVQTAPRRALTFGVGRTGEVDDDGMGDGVEEKTERRVGRWKGR